VELVVQRTWRELAFKDVAESGGLVERVGEGEIGTFRHGELDQEVVVRRDQRRCSHSLIRWRHGELDQEVVVRRDQRRCSHSLIRWVSITGELIDEP